MRLALFREYLVSFREHMALALAACDPNELYVGKRVASFKDSQNVFYDVTQKATAYALVATVEVAIH
jgi:hypothetical protein